MKVILRMEIEIKGNLKVKINQKDSTASVIESPKANGTVFIPRFAEHENVKYKIISIEKNAFKNCFIDRLTFAKDSEVETFEKNCFYNAHIKKLEIPESVKNLQNGWCNYLNDLTEIEVSPKNSRFIFYKKEFLLGKSIETSDKFDVLNYARFDIEEAVIPPQVAHINKYSFSNHKKLKKIGYSSNSKLNAIDNFAFSISSIEILSIPASVEQIGDWCFSDTHNLRKVEISSDNKIFRLIDGNYVVKESNRGSGVFDVIIFGRRDLKSISIPSHIREINNCAFQNCILLENVTFESNSSLESIKAWAFYHISGPERLVLPPSLKETYNSSFAEIKNIKSIEFLGKSVKIKTHSFSSCDNLSNVTFPNADQITFDNNAMSFTPEYLKIFVKRTAKLSGSGLGGFKGHINYIDDDSVTPEEPTEKVTATSDADRAKNDDVNNLSFEKENRNLKKFVSYLISRLSKYEEVISYDDFVSKKEEIESDKEQYEEEVPNEHAFVGPDEEEFQEVEKKIGEGGTSEVFKVSDRRTGEVMCKKVIKEISDDRAFKTLKNAVKEIDISQSVRHPCICDFLGYNTRERLPVIGKESEKTTVALFFELLPFSVKEVASKNLLSNTLKVRIAVEVAFGMSHLHSRGMMHRDLKLENIMMNSVFDSKIIDFGLVHASEMSDSFSSLTKGIGTLAYMSPEMVNEEEYDNKTDVYSYGVVLFALFTGSLPKQSMRDRLNNVMMEYPAASWNISEYCISLIKRCTSFKATERPTFDDIIDDMFSNNFQLASEVDVKAIKHRFRELNRIRSGQNKGNK
ncbi:hypothetical protein M9Y10_032907 [Tritrichomonas musculus]|uniref:Protein kinase domain-containing protein n=1 Tax=Tritrichomonas musculus TaxID=1915356 RepID=A0ABR2H038_9EUKA